MSNKDDFEDKTDIDEFDDEFSEGDDFNEKGASPTSSNKTSGSLDKATLIKYGAIAALTLMMGYFIYASFSQTKSAAIEKKEDLKIAQPKSIQAAANADQAQPAAATNANLSEIEKLEAEFNGTAPANANTNQEKQDAFKVTDLILDDNKATNDNPIKSNNDNFNGFIENQSNANQIVTKTVAAVDPKVQESIATLTEEMTLNVNQIKQIESTVSSLNKTIDQLSQELAAMQQKFSAMQDKNNEINSDMLNIKKVLLEEDLDLARQSKLSSVGANEPLVYNKPDYIVHAIIPGRAWLKSTNGQIVTITEGDSIGDYGRVALIDATNNLVKTSSGVTFR